MRSGWLLRDGDVICALEMTQSPKERRRGLRAGSGDAGAVQCEGARGRHTVGRSGAVDVAFLGADLAVLHLARLAPWRMARPRKGVRSVLEAEAGSWDRWRIRVGDQLEIRPVEGERA
jgi:hypothetical protein